MRYLNPAKKSCKNEKIFRFYTESTIRNVVILAGFSPFSKYFSSAATETTTKTTVTNFDSELMMKGRIRNSNCRKLSKSFVKF